MSADEPTIPRRVLVTGGTGYLGGRLISALRTRGSDVAAIVRRDTPTHRLATLRNAGVITLEHDGDTGQLCDLLQEARPEVVFHCSTRFVSEHKVDDVAPLVRDNILFGVQVAEAMRRTGVRSLVVTGSAWQQHDNAAYSPMSLYAASKEALESMLAWYAQVGEVRVLVARLTDLYGPDDERRKLLWALRNAERTGQVLAMNDGSPFIDLLHIDDAVNALLTAAARLEGTSVPFETWAVRTGRSLPLRDLVRVWQSVRGTRVNVEWGARPLRARETMKPWTATALLPDWSAKIPLEEGLLQL